MRSFIISYCLPYRIKEDETSRACRTYGEKRNKYMVLVGMPKETTRKTQREVEG
jgi:hypothetical protein